MFGVIKEFPRSCLVELRRYGFSFFGYDFKKGKIFVVSPLPFDRQLKTDRAMVIDASRCLDRKLRDVYFVSINGCEAE